MYAGDGRNSRRCRSDSGPAGAGPGARHARAVAIEGYRSGTLSAYQIRRMLGFETRYELDGFLKAHNVWENSYGLEELEQDRQTLQQLASEGRLRG